MAALPYIQLYVADYLADTIHLTTEEHGAYLLIIFNYWQTGKPIPESRLAAITKLSPERWESARETLSEFFNITDAGLWLHERIDEDLEKVRAKSIKASRAGKRSAEKRASQVIDNNDDSNERSTNVPTNVQHTSERTFNHTDTEADTEADTDKTKTPMSSATRSDPIPVQAIVNLYHEKLPNLPKVAKMTKAREGYIKQRWREDMGSLDQWENFFDYVEQSDFLMGKATPTNGRSSPFRATLDWLTKAENFAKIAEGKYHV